MGLRFVRASPDLQEGDRCTEEKVCGSLDVYQPVKNIELECTDLKHDISIESHSRYWSFARMYRDIITGFDFR